MEFKDWVKRYEKKSGEKHISPPGFTTLFDKDKGYAQYGIEHERLWIYEVCGDGRYWYNKGLKVCKDQGLKYICTICTAPIFPYLRLMGGKIKSKIQQPERNNGWKIEGENHLGFRFFVWPAWFDTGKQRHAYYIVSEVKK